jgi:RHS repeat-associated protein
MAPQVGVRAVGVLLPQWETVVAAAGAVAAAARTFNTLWALALCLLPHVPTTYSYDLAGNQTVVTAPAASRTTYGWDYENRLLTVKLPASVPNTMQYDGDGRRVQKQDSTGLTNYAWDEQNIVQEADQHNVTQATYTLGRAYYGELISQRRGSTTNSFGFDGLGSTDRLTNVAGTVTDTYRYRAFGSVQASTGTTTNPYKYGGQIGYYMQPDLSQFHARTRLADPNSGRWLSIDANHADPNEYRYVMNNPVNDTDPSGQQALQCHSRHLRRGSCGQFSWSVYWELAEKAIFGGVVVQKVEMTPKIMDCHRRLLDAKTLLARFRLNIAWWPLWEGGGPQWAINATTQRTLQRDQLHRGHDDLFKMPSFRTGTQGTITIKGIAEFHAVGPIRIPGFKPNPFSPAQDLPSTQVEANYTNLQKLNKGTGAIEHSITVGWDCCKRTFPIIGQLIEGRTRALRVKCDT